MIGIVKTDFVDKSVMDYRLDNSQSMEMSMQKPPLLVLALIAEILLPTVRPFTVPSMDIP